MTALSTFVRANPNTKSAALLLAKIVGCSLLIALCAQIRILLPFSPVPLTLQTLAVMIVGAMLGSKAGALSVLLYLAEGMMGLPMLSGGRIDPLFLLSPVGGYYIGFVFQAYLVGWFFERRDQMSQAMLLGGLALASAVDFAFGAVCLSPFVGLQNVVMLGVIPFIPGEIVKIVAVLSIFKRNAVG